jgi:hypothetical protein
MSHRVAAGGQFIRSGFWLLLLGFLMSFGMVMHYVVGAQYPIGHHFRENITLWWACPWTLYTAVVLGGALCMAVIGAILILLGKGPASSDVGKPVSVALARCKFSLISIFLTGYVGYFMVDAKWPAFYYEPVSDGKNVWLFLQLACMAGFALRVVLACDDIRRATRSMA